jgi:DNA-directed RNA polymerase subunit RPC12/RpoP
MGNHVKCPECNNKTAIFVNKEDLPSQTSSVLTGTSGFNKPEQYVGIVEIILEIIKDLIWLAKDNKTKYLICKSCGYYEKQ